MRFLELIATKLKKAFEAFDNWLNEEVDTRPPEPSIHQSVLDQVDCDDYDCTRNS